MTIYFNLKPPKLKPFDIRTTLKLAQTIEEGVRKVMPEAGRLAIDCPASDYQDCPDEPNPFVAEAGQPFEDFSVAIKRERLFGFDPWVTVLRRDPKDPNHFEVYAKTDMMPAVQQVVDSIDPSGKLSFDVLDLSSGKHLHQPPPGAKPWRPHSG